MQRIVAFDVETPNFRNDRICAIGLTIIEDLRLVHSKYYLVDPQCHFDYRNVLIHGITPDMVDGERNFSEVWSEIAPLMRGNLLAAHNAQFDMAVLKKTLFAYGIEEGPMPYVCTVRLARSILKQTENHRLPTLCDLYGIQLDHHNAASDSDACAQILCNLVSEGAPIQKYIKTYDMIY